MEKISVIMPVYNVERYIRESLNSVINQTYKNLEIILVDDGSKDLSGNICDEYSKKDKRVKVIHKENGGLSSARNAGLDVATGKYIMFIDSDDYYEKNACELLCNAIGSQKADYVIGNYIHITHDGVKWDEPLFDKNIYNNFTLSIKDYKKSFFVMNSVVWNKIFKRDFIESHNLRFVPEAIAEDAIFSTYCYVHANKGYFINDIVYNYRQNESNLSISTNCTKKYFENLEHSYKLIFDNFQKTDNLGFYRFFYARIMPYLLCKIIDTNALKKSEEMLEILRDFSWFFNQKDLYKVVVINKHLNQIVQNINKGNYLKVLKLIEETKKYRNRISDVEKEKMYAPNEELYKVMSKSDELFIGENKLL